MSTQTEDYAAIHDQVAYVELDPRTLLEVTGADRSAFLHKFCTNDVLQLERGSGCEAFLANVQGKIVGHGLFFCYDGMLRFSTVPDQGNRLVEHLDRYILREDVQVHDRTDAWRELVIAGRSAESLLQRVLGRPLPTERFEHAVVPLGDHDVHVARVDWITPPHLLLRLPAQRLADVVELLREAGATQCGVAAFEAARIEHGTPWFGRDIDSNRFPQEIGRDRQAICFTKGCYLGQETVARLDALGHVNHRLVGIRFEGTDVPERDTELEVEGKLVGQVTSAVLSPKLDAPLALGYVRRGHNHPGTRLDSRHGRAHVVELPV
ncbi:MAG: folate-binding protein YgfZ [Pirellulales bacterium]